MFSRNFECVITTRDTNLLSPDSQYNFDIGIEKLLVTILIFATDSSVLFPDRSFWWFD